MLAPPSMMPDIDGDLRRGAGVDAALIDKKAIARLSAWTGLPMPKSLQLWPPAPENVTSKRRLPSA